MHEHAGVGDFVYVLAVNLQIIDRLRQAVQHFMMNNLSKAVAGANMLSRDKFA